MSRQMLKNYCIEPTTKDCTCTRDIRCGGIVATSANCPEHSARGAAPVDILRTHFHEVQGDEGFELEPEALAS